MNWTTWKRFTCQSTAVMIAPVSCCPFMDTLRLGFPRLLLTLHYASCYHHPLWTSISVGNGFLHVMNGLLLEPGRCQGSLMAYCWQVLLGAPRQSTRQSGKTVHKTHLKTYLKTRHLKTHLLLSKSVKQYFTHCFHFLPR